MVKKEKKQMLPPTSTMTDTNLMDDPGLAAFMLNRFQTIVDIK